MSRSIRWLLLACVLLSWNGCSDYGLEDGHEQFTPPWLAALIDQFKASPVGSPPQSVWRYDYHGQVVFYTPAQCCDQFSILYDINGNILCAPDGGFAGGGDGKCRDFFQERKNGVLVWRDTRMR